jgi:hypothetical protein
MPGSDQGPAAIVTWCLPANSSAREPGEHPAEPIGEVRSGAAETDEETGSSWCSRPGTAARTLPEPAGGAVVLGAHVASRSFPGGLRPRPAARQPDPGLRDCW